MVGKWSAGFILRRQSLLLYQLWNLMIMHMGVDEPLDFSEGIFLGFEDLYLSGKFVLLQVVR